MRLSIYTFVKNGIHQDYHVVDMLRHHVPLADEIVVNEGYSTDGTFERISALDPRIKIFRTHWGQANSFDWFLNFKNEARRRCTGDWCILLDCDEFIPEWEFARLRDCLTQTKDVMIPLRLVNFYANYKVFHRAPEKPNWPARKMAIHRNLPEIEVWGDGSNVRLHGQEFDWGVSQEEFLCHHFGFVRSAARLREKWRNLQGNLHGTRQKWFRLPSFLFDWFPHHWADPQFLPDLEVYDGPFIQAVRDNPDEFVRDRFSLYQLLKERGRSPMCGIAGVMYADGARPVDRVLLKAMSDRIAHRGPDAEGFWTGRGVGLAHRRLSIIDLASGDQPITNEDGSVWVVFNGEIYNYRDIRAELLARGHHLRTNSDTEVLVHLYEDEGDDFVRRLRGMFAFALWDERRQRLLLARDRLGIKPLYVYRDAERILFGSEIKALLACPDLPRELDARALEDYFAFGMVPGPRSIFRNIEKLQPAHILAIERDKPDATPQRYWQFRLEPDLRPTAEEWAEAIRAKLTETARAHLIADVPVGAFLSGGVDSSAIVAACAGATNGPMQTFSIGFHEKEFSELPYARQVAARFGTVHTEEVVTADAVALLDELTRFYDEPFADPSALPTFLVSRLAARSVKVVLSGDGGDEAFGGYARYAHDLKEDVLRRWLPGWFRRRVLGPLARVWPKADWLPRPLRVKTLMTNLALDAGPAYANTLGVCRPPLRRRLLSADVRERLNGHDPDEILVARHALAESGRPLDGMLSADVAVILPDDFLVKVDRASMAHGLEVRPPLLDHELLELAARIPADLKVHKGETKWVFKRAIENELPHEVVWRRKQGFEVPIDSWLRGPLRSMFEEAVLTSGSAVAPLVDRVAIESLYRRHLSGIGRHGPALWSLLVLARWAERYLGSDRVNPEASAHVPAR